MNKVIQLQEYSERRRRPVDPLVGQKLWVCGRCGSHHWTVAVDAQVHCSRCNARACNLEVVERGNPSGPPQ